MAGASRRQHSRQRGHMYRGPTVRRDTVCLRNMTEGREQDEAERKLGADHAGPAVHVKLWTLMEKQ